MQIRNGRKERRKSSSRPFYQRRMKELHNADAEFIDDLEANTNFTMKASRHGKQRSNTSLKHATTILSQVKKYGIEDQARIFVRTDQGVTDDPDNYVVRQSDFDHSHIQPKRAPVKAEQQKLPKIRHAQTFTRNFKDAELDSHSKIKAAGINAFTVGGGELASARDALPKPMFQILSNPPPQANQKNDHKEVGIPELREPASDDAGESKLTPPASEAKHRTSQPLSLASQQKTTLQVTKQIEEKAGSTNFLLNEDSENSDHIPIDEESDQNKLQMNQTIKAVESLERLQVYAPKQRTFQNPPQQQSEITKTRKSKSSKQPKRVVSTSGTDFERIQELVEQENKRLWRLYDNRLKDGMTFDQIQAKSRIHQQRRSLGMNKNESQKHSDLQRQGSEHQVEQFLEAVKNHTVYRRDNLVSKMANQTKQSLDPYLRFSTKPKPDAFETRPLSSAILRAGGMYPSRDTIARANMTDGAPMQANRTFNMNRNTLRPGQVRPLSSNLHNMVLLKDQSSQFQTQQVGQYRKSMDTLGKGKSRGGVQVSESHAMPSRRTTVGDGANLPGLMSSSAIDSKDKAQQVMTQHQRLLSYQMGFMRSGQVDAGDQKRGKPKHRPVSSVPYTGRHAVFSNGQQRASEKDEIEMISDPAIGEDFVNVRQMFDPSLGASQPKSMTGDKRMQFLMSDTDMQSFSTKNQQVQQNQDSNQEYSQMLLQQNQMATQSDLQSQIIKTTGNSKTSQDLISQLRIKSVRQSKVRIVEDKHISGHFEIQTDLPEDNEAKGVTQGRDHGFMSQQVSTRPLLPKDKVISNATNLHRAADTALQQIDRLNSDPVRQSTEYLQAGTLSQEPPINEFPDAQCVQLDIEVLEQYPVVVHMQDFLIFTETRSPIFIYDPEGCAPTRITLILQRFKECIEAGELEQAMSLLDLGMKQSQFVPIFKFNVGITYLLSQQYLEAIQTFRLLAKSYPFSTSVHSNLLFAYLCDGWVSSVKEFQSTALFRSIQAPLSAKTKSILELIKFAFTSADLLLLGSAKRPRSAPRISAVQSTKNRPIQEAQDPLTEQNHVVEADSEEERETDQTTLIEEDLVDFVNFKWFPKIKDYTRREKLQPINHLLKKKLRDERLFGGAAPPHVADRSKSLSPLRHDPFGHLPDYWESYQKMLKVYHKKDRKKCKEVRAYFEQVLTRIHKLCDDEEEFQRGIKSKIVKQPFSLEKQQRSTAKSRASRHKSKSQSSQKSQNTRKQERTRGDVEVNSSNGREEEQQRGDGDVNKLLRKVKKVEEKNVKELQTDEGQTLDAIFKQLVSQRATYISETVEDPIENSFFQLVEGLAVFHEKYNIRTFIDEYLALQDDIRQSEQIQQFIDAQGGASWNVDQQLRDQVLSKKEWNERFLEKFEVNEEQTMRARQFLLDVLFGKQENEILSLKPVIEQMAHAHVDRMNQQAMDTERFETEQTFTHVLRLLIELQQDLVGRMRRAENAEVKGKLQDEHFVNEWYIKKLKKRKNLSGRHDEIVLLQTLKMSKVEREAQTDLEIKVQSPLNHEKLEPMPVSSEKENEFRELYTRGWEKQCKYRMLAPEERLEIAEQISAEADQVLKRARVNAQKRILNRLKAVKKKDQAVKQKILDHEAKLEEYMTEITEEQKEKELNQESEEKQEPSSGRGSASRSKKEKKTVRMKQIDDFEMNTFNMKLNLDAIEITAELPKSHTEDIGLWEETAALKVIKKKIELINETLTDPQTLFQKDEIKHKPLLEKWNNSSGDLQARQKQQKFLNRLGGAVNGDLKDPTLDQEKGHLQVRPMIGHEMDDTQVGLIEQTVKLWQEISPKEQKQLDTLISSKNRFFSIFDEDTRLAMYEHCTIHRYYGKDRVIVHDVEEDNYSSDEDEDLSEQEREQCREARQADPARRIHILLRGNIHIVQVNEELDIQLRLASLRAGEVCGDQSIQRKIRDPLKVLSQERKTALTNSEETITISIGKEKFMAALFEEMQLELFYKIILLRNTSFFEELSPYSLLIIASNVEVREVKYGEIIVQQGQMPDAMYILAHGQCKTVYQYVDEKSTKVSKYANKCLKSDLPAPVHTGHTNYLRMPFKQRRRLEEDAANDDESYEIEILRHKQTEQDTYNKPKLLNKRIHEKLAKQGKTISKRSFPNTILGENKKAMKIMFQNHMMYSKLKVGQVFGMRSLLDPLISKKHILEHRKFFCGKLDLPLEPLWEELVKQMQLTLDEQDFEMIKRKEANMRATKGCVKCFEQDKLNCTCKLDQLSPEQREIAKKEWQQRQEAKLQGRESPLVQEFNDSHLHDITLSHNEDLADIESPRNPKNLSPTNKLSLDPREAMREQRDLVRDQIEKLVQPKEQESKEPKLDKKKKDHKERLQLKVEEEFCERLYPKLMQAQVSIIVTSATAKFLVIKKEDKSLLNEYLRVCMDRAILETNFEDLDRPERNHSDVQTREARARGWTTRKEKMMNQIMKEAKMEKKSNKLLDD